MITNVRKRSLHEPPLYEPHPGYIMQYDEGTKLFVPVEAFSSTHDFNASDFKLKDQVVLGMDLKPSTIQSNKLSKAEQLGNVIRTLQQSEFEANQEDAVSAAPPSIPQEPVE